MTTRNSYTKQDKTTAIDYYKKHKGQLPLKSIAVKVGVPYFTLYSWLKAGGIAIMNVKDYETRFVVCNDAIEYAKANDNCDLTSVSRKHNISLKFMKRWLIDSGRRKFIVNHTLYSPEFIDSLSHMRTVELKTVSEIADTVRLPICTVSILLKNHKHTKHVTTTGLELCEAVKPDKRSSDPDRIRDIITSGGEFVCCEDVEPMDEGKTLNLKEDFTNVKTENIDTVNILRSKLEDIRVQINTYNVEITELQEQMKSIEHTIKILGFKG